MLDAQLKSQMVSESPPPVRAELRRLLVLAGPTVGAKFSHMALGFTDFVLVSWMGTEATAAISPATLFVFIVLCLGMGSVSSVQTFAAQALGRREPQRASVYVWQAIYVGLFFLAATYPLNQLARPFWTWIGHPERVREMEIAYCTAAFWSMGLSIMCVGLESFFNGVQKPGVALCSILVAIVFNAFADYALIFGKFGMPELGIAGAAIATVISWAIRVVIMLAVFLSMEFNRTFQTRRHWRPDIGKLVELFRVGGPIGVQWFLDVASWFVFITLMMASFSTETLAATNIALQLMHLSFMPAIGIGTATSSLVGHAIGERRFDLAMRRARIGFGVTVTFMGFVGLLYWLGRYRWIGLLSTDPDVIRIGAGILIWTAIFQVFDAMGISYICSLRGAGDTKGPALLVVFHCWVVFIAGGYVVTRLAPGLGFHGPWMMCTLYIILLGLSLWRRWNRGAWKKIELFKQTEIPPAGDVPIESMPALTVDG